MENILIDLETYVTEYYIYVDVRPTKMTYIHYCYYKGNGNSERIHISRAQCIFYKASQEAEVDSRIKLGWAVN